MAAAEALLEKGLYPPAVFHCQQAPEKMLKAIWVEVKDEVPPRTQNLVDLAQGLNLLMNENESFLRTLTAQAVASRYLGEEYYTRAQAQDYYERTTELCERLRQRLK